MPADCGLAEGSLGAALSTTGMLKGGFDMVAAVTRDARVGSTVVAPCRVSDCLGCAALGRLGTSGLSMSMGTVPPVLGLALTPTSVFPGIEGVRSEGLEVLSS